VVVVFAPHWQNSKYKRQKLKKLTKTCMVNSTIRITQLKTAKKWKKVITLHHI